VSAASCPQGQKTMTTVHKKAAQRDPHVGKQAARMSTTFPESAHSRQSRNASAFPLIRTCIRRQIRKSIWLSTEEEIMFDTKKRNTSKLMVFIVTIAFMLSGVPVRFSGKAEASRPRSEKVSKPSSGESRSFTVQSGTTYDKLLQDNSSGTSSGSIQQPASTCSPGAATAIRSAALATSQFTAAPTL